MFERYRQAVQNLNLKVEKEHLDEDDRLGWIIRALAVERLKSQDNTYTKLWGRGLRPADPIGDSPSANLKRLEILDLRVGHRLFDLVAPLKESLTRTIDESGEAKVKKVPVRSIEPGQLHKIESSVRAQIEQSITALIAYEAAKGPKVDISPGLAKVGRLASRSVGL
jgi:hypothetical protein